MDQVKLQIKKLREEYETSAEKRKLRILIFELEKKLRNLCIQHCGAIIYDEYGDWDYSEIDIDGNCKICGLPINFMGSSV